MSALVFFVAAALGIGGYKYNIILIKNNFQLSQSDSLLKCTLALFFFFKRTVMLSSCAFETCGIDITSFGTLATAVVVGEFIPGRKSIPPGGALMCGCGF